MNILLSGANRKNGEWNQKFSKETKWYKYNLWLWPEKVWERRISYI